MVVVALPPAMDMVRQALTVPAPAIVQEVEPILSEDQNASVKALDRANVALEAAIRGRIAELRRLMSDLETQAREADELPPECVQALRAGFDFAIDDAVNGIRQMEARHEDPRLPQIPRWARRRFRRCFDEAARSATRYHDAVVESYYRFLAIEADHDPASRQIVGRTSSPEELDAFFASLPA